MENKNTLYFQVGSEKSMETRKVLNDDYAALKEKGYNPISQLVGYVVSGDPTYVTNHKNARALITRIDRDDILEEVFKFYLENVDRTNEEDA